MITSNSVEMLRVKCYVSIVTGMIDSTIRLGLVEADILGHYFSAILSAVPSRYHVTGFSGLGGFDDKIAF